MFPIQEALSAIFGYISLLSWTSVFIPQLVENYRQQSADALSLAFILVWTTGDTLNLIGAIWVGLAPVVIVNHVDFCVTDLVMIIQCLYYKSGLFTRREAGLAKRRNSLFDGDANELEDSCDFTPLITQRDLGNAEAGLIRGYATSKSQNSVLGREKSHKGQRVCDLTVIKPVLAITVLGLAGWMIAYRSGLWQPSSTEEPHRGVDRAVGAQILGYVGASVTMSARFPQIFKNLREKDSTGLSPSFVAISLLGNIAYGGSVFCQSFDRDYIIMSLPWTLGSVIPALQDLTILIQIQIYRPETKEKVAVPSFD